jgi:hypothetical protein
MKYKKINQSEKNFCLSKSSALNAGISKIGFRNKKGINFLAAHVIAIMLTLLFLSGMLLLLARVGKGDAFTEEAYAKKICLSIDSMKKGTEIEIFAPELFDRADKNRYNGPIVFTDYAGGKLTVKVAEGEGYDCTYFTQLNSLVIDSSKKAVIVKA